MFLARKFTPRAFFSNSSIPVIYVGPSLRGPDRRAASRNFSSRSGHYTRSRSVLPTDLGRRRGGGGEHDRRSFEKKKKCKPFETRNSRVRWNRSRARTFMKSPPFFFLFIQPNANLDANSIRVLLNRITLLFVLRIFAYLTVSYFKCVFWDF